LRFVVRLENVKNVGKWILRLVGSEVQCEEEGPTVAVRLL